MANRDAEIFNRIGHLEQHQARAEVEHVVVKETIAQMIERIEHLENWKVELKVTLAKYMGILGSIWVASQFVATIIIQYIVHQITK